MCNDARSHSNLSILYQTSWVASYFQSSVGQGLMICWCSDLLINRWFLCWTVLGLSSAEQKCLRHSQHLSNLKQKPFINKCHESRIEIRILASACLQFMQFCRSRDSWCEFEMSAMACLKVSCSFPGKCCDWFHWWTMYSYTKIKWKSATLSLNYSKQYAQCLS